MEVGFVDGVEPATPAEIAREVAELEGGRQGRAELLRQRFEDWDREEREERMSDFLTKVGMHWEEAVGQIREREEREAEWEERQRRMVLVTNLGWNVTQEMVEGTFDQIGEVAAVEMGIGAGWAQVEFGTAEAAVGAQQRFGGVELAGRPMVCKLMHARPITCHRLCPIPRA